MTDAPTTTSASARAALQRQADDAPRVDLAAGALQAGAPDPRAAADRRRRRRRWPWPRRRTGRRPRHRDQLRATTTATPAEDAEQPSTDGHTQAAARGHRRVLGRPGAGDDPRCRTSRAARSSTPTVQHVSCRCDGLTRRRTRPGRRGVGSVLGRRTRRRLRHGRACVLPRAPGDCGPVVDSDGTIGVGRAASVDEPSTI